MPLGAGVFLNPRHIVLDEAWLPLKGAQNPYLSVHAYCGQTVAHFSYS